MSVKRSFVEEVKHRQAEREHRVSLTQGQRYVVRELRVLFGLADEDSDQRGQINVLDKAFRGPITTAVNRELNALRRNGVRGKELFKHLIRIYHQHRMRDWEDRGEAEALEAEIPRIICSEALI